MEYRKVARLKKSLRRKGRPAKEPLHGCDSRVLVFVPPAEAAKKGPQKKRQRTNTGTVAPKKQTPPKSKAKRKKRKVQKINGKQATKKMAIKSKSKM